ncbi:uncharacterized protein I303_107370 [Kwoniella dejecticola CBS 10117]|uniref:Uncharacterized protein n=1 Tax=Kwoniella dejecticola CBS 10117 TaxID=1296121 RepID=A0A1A5ZZH8_9TREE|nr:uncharacterized protein I303_06773 [Kwoniella dejecticola CBS 10117]OBR83214.1 hypothetical protein I303_06773 [Kwoniella dejecticola CBS 10117]
MPRDPKKSSHRSSDPKKRSHCSREGERSSPERKHRSSPKDDAQKRVKDTAKTVENGAGKAYDAIADLFGGEKELNRTIRRYNPAFYEFADQTFLKNFGLPNKPSKFLLFIIALALLQSFVPLFQWPLDFVARWLGFVFLFGSGTEELRAGFESSRKANKIKSLLTVFLILSALQLIPNFLFDTYYHFGALWAFFLPVILFITPFKENPDQTIASMFCDTFFSSFSMGLGSLIPYSLQGENAQNMAILSGGIVAVLFWVGYLESVAAYVTVWCFLALSTVNTLGETFVAKDESSSGFFRQMKIWHNLMAIWLWRYLISAIEGIAIPGIVSVIGLIQYYLPSYFLWMTGFMFAMLMTKKTEKRHRADTWYAKWLIGVSKATSPTSTPRASSGSGSGGDGRSSGRSSKRSRESGDRSKRPSGSDRHRSSRSEKDRKRSK